MIFKHNGSTGQESFKSEQVGEKASEIGVGTQMEGNLWSLASQQGTGKWSLMVWKEKADVGDTICQLYVNPLLGYLLEMAPFLCKSKWYDL